MTSKVRDVVEYLHKHVQPQMLLLLMLSIGLLTILAAHLYVFKAPLKDYGLSRRTLEILQEDARAGLPLGDEIETLEKSLKEDSRKLHGSGSRQPANKMVAFVIGKIDSIAARYDLRLASVKPGKKEEVFMFEEMPFHIEIQGTYFGLFEWLHDVEHELGPLVVKQFHVQPESDSEIRRMELTMVSYQLAKRKP